MTQTLDNFIFFFFLFIISFNMRITRMTTKNTILLTMQRLSYIGNLKCLQARLYSGAAQHWFSPFAWKVFFCLDMRPNKALPNFCEQC